MVSEKQRIEEKREAQRMHSAAVKILISLFLSSSAIFFGEIRNLTTFTRLMDYNNGFSLSFW